MKRTRQILLAIALALLGALGQAAEEAQQQKLALNIQSQSMEDALNQFAQQAGLQLLFQSRATLNQTAPAVVGMLTPQEGLERLLANSGLRYEFINRNTVTIRAERAGKAAVKHTSEDFRLARAQTESAPAAQKPARETQTIEESRGVPEMLVKGKRSINTDIERTEDDVQPYVVFDAKTIERSMASNLEQFFKTRLPQNTLAASNSQDSIGGYGNQSAIDLRGLGTNQTLILINGRRAPAISNQTLGGSFGQADLNGIPLSSVERIEVLPSTASGIYGGGATGGVINVILKRNYQGIEIKGRYENAFDTDIAERNLEANAGFSLEGGKTSIMLAASYSASNELQVRERDFYQRSRELLTANNPTWFLDEFSPPAGYTTNISGQFGAELVLDDGTPLGTSITHVPVGYLGVASDNGQALIDNAGSYNMDLPNDLNGALASLVSNPKIESYSANIRREFGSRVEAFVDVSRYKNLGRTVDGDLLQGVTLLADAPNNPFNEDVDVTFPMPGLSSISTSMSQTTQASAGLLVRLPHSWTVQGDYNWSESRNAYRSGNPLVNDTAAELISDGSIDVVRDLNLDPIDFSDYRLQNPNFISGPADTVLNDYSLRLAGPLFMLPGGAATLSALLERREQEAKPTYQTNPVFGDSSLLETAYYPMRRQDVDSAYMETQLPLVGANNRMHFVHSLQFQVSGRRDRYKTNTVPLGTLPVSEPGEIPDLSTVVRTIATATSTDYTVGLRYAPVNDVTFRLSYGTGFLPASINQLVSTTNPRGRITVTDPKRNNQRYTATNVITLRSGNPNLSPEQSASLSAGIILTPDALPGFRFSVDYTRIRKSDEIRSLNEQLTVNNEDLLPGRVGRAAPSSADLAAGITSGRINYIDLTLLNIATTEIKAYDFQADYLWNTRYGEFTAYALTTWQPHFQRQLTPTSTVVETSGYAGTSALQWRGNGGVTLQRGPWTFGWNAQFYDSYYVYGPDTSESARIIAAENQGSAVIPRQIYHDLLAEYRLGQVDALGGLFSNTELSVGVQNIFNTVPPIIASSQLYGSYSFYGDPRLRRYSVSLRKSFQ